MTDNKSAHINVNDKDDIKKRNEIERSSWTVDSKCLIFSNSFNKWVIGAIIKIYNDNAGEWLTVKYMTDMMRTKQVQRHYKDIKPICNVKTQEQKMDENVVKTDVLEELGIGTGDYNINKLFNNDNINKNEYCLDRIKCILL
eukprot:508135_1